MPTDETDAELDRQLQGTSAGQILKFTDILGADFPDGIAGQEADFTVIVKEVKAKQLPELDDDFALSASEFDTIDELRADVGERVGRAKRFQARQLLRGKVVEAVTELADFPLPPSLVAEESAYRLDRLAHEASHYGMTIEQYLQLTGRSMDELKDEAERGARETVKSMLVLDAVGRAAGIEVEQSDLGEELARQSMRLGPARPGDGRAHAAAGPDQRAGRRRLPPQDHRPPGRVGRGPRRPAAGAGSRRRGRARGDGGRAAAGRRAGRRRARPRSRGRRRRAASRTPAPTATATLARP